MIQRIQSVYLFFVFCLMAIPVFVPFYPSSTTSFMTGFNRGYFAMVAVLAIITIFFYKKRNKQIGICYAMLLLIILIYCINFIFDRLRIPVIELFSHTRFIFVFPVIAFILIYLAIRAIKKDEKLVRSLDRLR